MRHANRKPVHGRLPPASGGDGGSPTLPGITRGNPAAGGAKLVAVDERGVDLAQQRSGGGPQGFFRQRRGGAGKPVGGAGGGCGGRRCVVRGASKISGRAFQVEGAPQNPPARRV